MTTKKKSIKEQSILEQTKQDKISKEQTAKEETSKKQNAKEQTTQEETAQEQIAKKQSAQEQINRKTGKKDWESLGISNDFLFEKVMRNKELCRELVQMILPEIEVGEIRYPETEKSIREGVDAKSVRLDVYAKDGSGKVYNLEMQTTDTKELPKRSRYYQSMIDLSELSKGESYRRLNESFIIFICPFDVFGKGRYQYTFYNTCEEERGLKLEDGAVKIFLNAKGRSGEISEELKSFLSYVNGKRAESAFTKRLEAEVQKAKNNREWRRTYMTVYMKLQEAEERGYERGLEQGKEQGLKQGVGQGLKQGLEEGRIQTKNIFKLYMEGKSVPEIAEELKLSEEEVKNILA